MFRLVFLCFVGLLAITPSYGAFCRDKGTLASRIKTFIIDLDADSSGVISARELYDFLRTFDTSYTHGSCVDRSEYVTNLELRYKFSRELGEVDYNDVIGKFSCPLELQRVIDLSPAPMSFRDLEIAIVGRVKIMCNTYANQWLNNCDCAQLWDSCHNDPEFTGLDVCQQLVTSTNTVG